MSRLDRFDEAQQGESNERDDGDGAKYRECLAWDLHVDLDLPMFLTTGKVARRLDGSNRGKGLPGAQFRCLAAGLLVAGRPDVWRHRQKRRTELQDDVLVLAKHDRLRRSRVRLLIDGDLDRFAVADAIAVDNGRV